MDQITYTVQGPDEEFTTVHTCGGPVQAVRMCYPNLFGIAPVSWDTEEDRTTVTTPKEVFLVRRLR